MHQLEVPHPMRHGRSGTSATALPYSRTVATATALYPPTQMQAGPGAFKLTLGHGEVVTAKGPFNKAVQHQVKSPSTVHDMPLFGLPLRRPMPCPSPRLTSNLLPSRWHRRRISPAIHDPI